MASFVFLLMDNENVRAFESLDVLASREDVRKVTHLPGGHVSVVFTNGTVVPVRRVALERDISSPELSSPAPVPRRCESALSSVGALGNEDGTSPLLAGMRASSPKSPSADSSSAFEPFRTPERKRQAPVCPDIPRRIRVSPKRLRDAYDDVVGADTVLSPKTPSSESAPPSAQNL